MLSILRSSIVRWERDGRHCEVDALGCKRRGCARDANGRIRLACAFCVWLFAAREGVQGARAPIWLVLAGLADGKREGAGASGDLDHGARAEEVGKESKWCWAG